MEGAAAGGSVTTLTAGGSVTTRAAEVVEALLETYVEADCAAAATASA